MNKDNADNANEDDNYKVNDNEDNDNQDKNNVPSSAVWPFFVDMHYRT